MDQLPKLTQMSSEDKDKLLFSFFEELGLLRAENIRLESKIKELGSLCTENIMLKNKIKELEARLSKNSNNSSKPPSGDGLAKPNPKSQREKSNRKSGGQAGHVGQTLKQVEHPDFIENHRATVCQHCCLPLDPLPSDAYEARQEFEIPPAKVDVTEHRAHITTCSHCGHPNKAPFPDTITQPVQYGNRVKALAVYYNQEQLIPYARLQDMFQDVHAVALSEGTLYNINLSCYNKLEATELTIKEAVTSSSAVHFDESGLRVQTKLHWLHVASTPGLTYYAVHEKRGSKAMDSIGILPHYQGTAIHDHWAPYFKYDCSHSLCNAHHLRELTYHQENYDQRWCEKMKDHLLFVKKEVAQAKEQGAPSLTTERCLVLQKMYHRILNDGLKEIPDLPTPPKKRGRRKQHPSKNLWDRLSHHSVETLFFMFDFSIPFTNNLGERDIRMNKVKQKISGCFRSKLGAQFFCRTRGYISTMKKQGKNTLDAITDVFSGTGVMPFSCTEFKNTS